MRREASIKPFNKLLHNDILLLKGINREKLPDEYRRVFKNIMKRYGISRTTVYAELEKSVPGAYKKYESTSRRIIIGKKEITMIKELLASGKSQRHITRVMTLELGFRYTHYRIFKVKEMILSGGSTGEAIGGKQILEINETDASEQLLNPDAKIEELPPPEPVEFKGNISKFFTKLSMINLIDPKRKIKIKVSGIVYTVSTRVIKDCLGHIAYSANSGGKSIGELCRFDMETILTRELARLKHENEISPAAARQLESIRKSLLYSSPPGSDTAIQTGGYALEDIYLAVRHFAPTAARDDVVKFMSTCEREVN